MENVQNNSQFALRGGFLLKVPLLFANWHLKIKTTADITHVALGTRKTVLYSLKGIGSLF